MPSPAICRHLSLGGRKPVVSSALRRHRDHAMALVSMMTTLGLSASAQAIDGYSCLQNDTEIFLELNERPDNPELSCEVVLWTGAEERQPLWQLADDPAICHGHAENFKSILEGQQWQCKAESAKRMIAPIPKVSVGEAPKSAQETVEQPRRKPPRPKPLTGLIEGSSYSCRRDGQRRTLWVEMAGPDGHLPCQVLWTEGGQTTPNLMWLARNQAGFCAAKLPEALDRWARAGWQCRSQNEIAIPPTSNHPPRLDDADNHETPDKTDPIPTNPLPSMLGLLPEDNQSVGPLSRLPDIARWLKPDNAEIAIMEDIESNLAWVGNRFDLRARLIQDLERLSDVYGSRFIVWDGLFSSIYGGGYPDVVVLVTYRDIDQTPRFLLNVYRHGDGRYQMADSLLLDKGWADKPDKLRGYYLLTAKSGLN